MRLTPKTRLGPPKRDISARTKAALAAAKRRGVKLGGLRTGAGKIRQYQAAGVAATKAAADARLQDIADDLRALSAEGLSLNVMARLLNDADMRAPRGGSWTATAVSRALARLCALARLS